jgi:hypothetical protein
MLFPFVLLGGCFQRFNDDLPIDKCKGIRSCTQQSISNFVSYNNFSLPNRTFLFKLFCVYSPKTPGGTYPKKRRATPEEMKSLYKNNPWDLIELPEGKEAVGCKGVSTVRNKVDGLVERYNARLVAKGVTHMRRHLLQWKR